MRWSFSPSTPPRFIDVPGGKLGAELASGMLRLSFLREGRPVEAVEAAPGTAQGSLSARLSLPKAAVVLRVDPAFILGPGESVLLGAGLPLDVVVETASGSLIWEFRSLEYGKGWTGGLEGGESCLAMRFDPAAIASPLEAPAGEARAGISALVLNQGRRRVRVETILVPAQSLRLYALGDACFCDGIALTYDPEGSPKTSLRPLRSLLPEEPLRVIDEARESPQEKLLRRSRRFLRSLTGLGGS